MGQIAILPDSVADQIAAGEVVERPASVVKELVENALDAGATEVQVEIEGGGRSTIVVSDDGSGMERDDAVLALDRHATSKLRAAADLVGVATYGFRGEALPSIASVSRLELETAPRNGGGGEATLLEVNGGRLGRVETTTRQPGTTVTVRRIFFNAPARRKFLRSQASETRAVVQSLTVLALARLDVSFKLSSDGRQLIDAPRVSQIADRIEQLFGRQLAGQLITVDYGVGPVSVRGLIQRPADAKPAGRRAFLFVNGRPFRDAFLVRAAEAGYRGTIEPGLKPSMVLSLGVPADAVDVNVHPAKLEVRFRDRRLVEHAVEEAARHALGGFDSAAVVYAPRAPDGDATFDQGEFAPASLFAPPGPTMSGPVSEEPAEPGGLTLPDRVLQIFRTYLVFEGPEGLAIVDQHSAHERVLYEQAMADLGGATVSPQRLLLPMQIDLVAAELEAVEEHRELLAAVGFDAEPFGGSSIVLHAVPNPHPRFDARRCFEEIVADLARGRFGGWANRMERFGATYACRAAIKAGQPLESREIQSLLHRLFACRLPPHDVHGRPTIVQLPRTELERRFGRS